MNYEKSLKLFKLDDKDFKNLLNHRLDYIDDGDNSLVSSQDSLDKLNKQLSLNNEVFYVKNKEELEENTILTLSPKNSRNIPVHRPGEYIVLSVYIAGNYYSRPYYVIESSNKEESEYKISVLKKESGLVSVYLRNIKERSEVTIKGLFGNTYYNSIRDCNNIIAICSNYGINAVYSFAKRILSTGLKVTLNIIYSVKKYSDIIFLEELKSMAEKSSRINLEIVISEEIVEGYETGFASEKIISKYLTKDTSIIIYGEEGLLKYLNKEIENFKLPKKFIHYEDYLPRCNVKNAKKYQLIIKYNGKEYKHFCYNDKTLLDSIENSRLIIESLNRTGKDNCCNVKVLAGKVKIVNDVRNHTEKYLNMIDPANTYPNSNTIIEIS